MNLRPKLLLSSLSFYLLLMSCSPKITETQVEPPKTPVITTPTEKDNPCMTLAKLTPSQRDEAETAYVLYRDQMKSGSLAKALPLWKIAYTFAPAGNGKMTYQFEDGVKIYTELYKQSNDANLKKTYVDTVMAIYDKRIECYGEADYIAGRKAFDAYYNFSNEIPTDQIYEWFKVNLDSKKEKADYFVLNPFAKILYDKVIAEEISHEEGSKYANYLLSAVKYGKANCKEKECEAWDIINEYTPARLEVLEGLKGFYDCNYYMDKYFPLYQANPDDCEIIQNVLRKLSWARCDENDPKVQELLNVKKEKCYVAPPPPGCLKIAFDLYTQGRFQEAADKFDECIADSNDPEFKAKYSYLNAKIYYGDIKNYIKSRRYCLQAVEYKPNWGDPYILIGKLYASSGPLCGPGRGWDSQIVTWPAIDKFEYAKKIDPSVAAEANKLISTYRQYMPSKEDIFIRSIKAGDGFTVGCWIQERTTIRTAD